MSSPAPHEDFLAQDNTATSINGNDDEIWWSDNLLDNYVTESGCDDDSKFDDCCMIAKTFLRMIRLRGTQHGNENADSSVNAVLDHNVEDEHHS